MHSELEKINFGGYLELPELDGKMFSKIISESNKAKNQCQSNAANNAGETSNNNNNINNFELNHKSTNCYNGNKNDKESVISQQSMINSNSTLNNHIAMLQTDSSFLSAYDENIINNNFKCSYYLLEEIKIFIFLIIFLNYFNPLFIYKFF